jgi:hypothetical protein
MDQLPQRTFIEAETERRIEAPGAGAAQRATAFEIERKRIQEGSLTLRAEVLGGMGVRRFQAGGADRDTGVAAQWSGAETAIVGKQDRKKSVGNLPYSESG